MPMPQKQLLIQQVEAYIEAQDHQSLKSLLEDHRSSDIAEVVEAVDNEHRRLIFDLMDKPTSAEVLEKVDEATRAELFDLLEDEELAQLVSEMNPDDAVDIIAELDEEEKAGVLETIPTEDLRDIRRLMQYSDDSAGGIMDPVLISVSEDATVAEAISEIRASQIDEDFFSVYVIDNFGRFLGDVRLRLLLTSDESEKISSLIDPDTVYVTANADQEVVRNIFSKNDLIVAPVLDDNHNLIGRITADRIIEVAEEEAAEDLYAMAGTDADELDDVSVVHAARVRMTWLLPCLIGTSITALVLLYFKIHFGIIYVAAAAFAPMVGAISGNAGLQTSAIVISGLATGHLAAQRLSQVFIREVRIALLVALCCGIIGALLCAFLPGLLAATDKPITNSIDHFKIVTAFAVGMFLSITVSTTLGLFLPFAFKKIGIDPAIASGPLVTTANDSISVAIYMTLTFLLAG